MIARMPAGVYTYRRDKDGNTAYYAERPLYDAENLKWWCHVMYQIAICDDEKSYLRKIDDIVTIFLQKHKVIGKIKTFLSSSFMIGEIKEGNKYDIYILDIEMPESSGMDIVKEIRSNLPEAIVIFVTFHMKYVIDSFELEIFRYIPKPLLEERLPVALDAAFKRLAGQEDTYYRYTNAKRLEKIFYKDILYAYKEGKCTVFVLDHQQVRIREPLFEVYKKLSSESFIQADRCYIVNIQSICKVDNAQSKLILKNGIELSISKNRIQEIKKVVGLYWGTKL